LRRARAWRAGFGIATIIDRQCSPAQPLFHGEAPIAELRIADAMRQRHGAGRLIADPTSGGSDLARHS
jgi:hypothetical protein